MGSLVNNRADLLDWHRKMRGLPVGFLRRQGLIIGAVAAELRRSGYVVEIAGAGEDRVLHIEASPGEAARERGAMQTRLFESEPERERHGWGSDPD